MTGSPIIKSGSLQHSELVRTLVSGASKQKDASVAARASVTTISPEMALIEELRNENKRLQAVVAQDRADLEKARKEEYARGESAGKNQALTDEAKRTALVAETTQKALAAFQDKMESLEGLAILLARTGLDRIFTDHQDIDTLIAKAISHRLDILKDHSIIAVFVSPADFADDESLARLKAAVGDAKLNFETDRKLVSGDCRLSLKLGEVEIGVKPQLRQLDALLRDLADKVQN